jgi:hypothetical protein
MYQICIPSCFRSCTCKLHKSHVKIFACMRYLMFGRFIWDVWNLTKINYCLWRNFIFIYSSEGVTIRSSECFQSWNWIDKRYVLCSLIRRHVSTVASMDKANSMERLSEYERGPKDNRNLNVARELQVVARCAASCRESTQYSSSLPRGVNLGWLLLLLWGVFLSAC